MCMTVFIKAVFLYDPRNINVRVCFYFIFPIIADIHFFHLHLQKKGTVLEYNEVTYHFLKSNQYFFNYDLIITDKMCQQKNLCYILKFVLHYKINFFKNIYDHIFYELIHSNKKYKKILNLLLNILFTFKYLCFTFSSFSLS